MPKLPSVFSDEVIDELLKNAKRYIATMKSQMEKKHLIALGIAKSASPLLSPEQAFTSCDVQKNKLTDEADLLSSLTMINWLTYINQHLKHSYTSFNNCFYKPIRDPLRHMLSKKYSLTEPKNINPLRESMRGASYSQWLKVIPSLLSKQQEGSEEPQHKTTLFLLDSLGLNITPSHITEWVFNCVPKDTNRIKFAQKLLILNMPIRWINTFVSLYPRIEPNTLEDRADRFDTILKLLKINFSSYPKQIIIETLRKDALTINTFSLELITEEEKDTISVHDFVKSLIFVQANPSLLSTQQTQDTIESLCKILKTEQLTSLRIITADTLIVLCKKEKHLPDSLITMLFKGRHIGLKLERHIFKRVSNLLSAEQAEKLLRKQLKILTTPSAQTYRGEHTQVCKILPPIINAMPLDACNHLASELEGQPPFSDEVYRYGIQHILCALYIKIGQQSNGALNSVLHKNLNTIGAPEGVVDTHLYPIFKHLYKMLPGFTGKQFDMLHHAAGNHQKSNRHFRFFQVIASELRSTLLGEPATSSTAPAEVSPELAAALAPCEGPRSF